MKSRDAEIQGIKLSIMMLNKEINQGKPIDINEKVWLETIAVRDDLQNG